MTDNLHIFQVVRYISIYSMSQKIQPNRKEEGHCIFGGTETTNTQKPYSWLLTVKTIVKPNAEELHAKNQILSF